MPSLTANAQSCIICLEVRLTFSTLAKRPVRCAQIGPTQWKCCSKVRPRKGIGYAVSACLTRSAYISTCKRARGIGWVLQVGEVRSCTQGPGPISAETYCFNQKREHTRIHPDNTTSQGGQSPFIDDRLNSRIVLLHLPYAKHA